MCQGPLLWCVEKDLHVSGTEAFTTSGCGWRCELSCPDRGCSKAPAQPMHNPLPSYQLSRAYGKDAGQQYRKSAACQLSAAHCRQGRLWPSRADRCSLLSLSSHSLAPRLQICSTPKAEPPAHPHTQTSEPKSCTWAAGARAEGCSEAERDHDGAREAAILRSRTLNPTA